jgi:hypothetical protein
MALDFRTTSHRSATTIEMQEAAPKMNQPLRRLLPTTPPYGRQCPTCEKDIANNAECSFAVAKERGSKEEAMFTPISDGGGKWRRIPTADGRFGRLE